MHATAVAVHELVRPSQTSHRANTRHHTSTAQIMVNRTPGQPPHTAALAAASATTMAAAARPATARAAMERAVAAPHVHTRTGPQARARHMPQSALRRARRRPTGPQLAHVPHILIDLPEAGRPGGAPPTQRHAPLLPTVWWHAAVEPQGWECAPGSRSQEWRARKTHRTPLEAP